MMISLAPAVLLQFNQVGTEINARNPERRKNVFSSHAFSEKKETAILAVAKPQNGAWQWLVGKLLQMNFCFSFSFYTIF